MNFLNVFEQRVGSLFGATAQGRTAPFSFKKLAKKAAREMEAETFVVNGVDTAPALYTILVSSEDDITMRPLYPQLTSETAQFIEGQAQGKGYVFVGKPLVRFMADPSLKSGHFSVFAENVDASTLNRLREEESRFLGADPSLGGGLGGAASMNGGRGNFQPIQPMQPINTAAPAASAFQPQPLVAPQGSAAGLDVLPQEAVMDAENALIARGAAAAQAAPAQQAAAGLAGAGVAAGAAAQQVAAPQTVRVASAAPAPAAAPITCLLIDRKSGRTFTAAAPRVVIGRERTPGGVVLHDPNVSRAHAELSFDGQGWRIRDLNSTNGTLVNDVDIDECGLRDGDLITLGLTNLEFREN